MRRPHHFSFLSLLGALVLAAPALAASTPDSHLPELQRLTAYDAQQPLDVKEVRSERRGDVTVTELTYASPLGGPVPAWLVLPPGRGPFPAVLFQHWGEGTKNEFLDEATSLARAGVVSLLVDAPFVRPEPWRRPMVGPQMGDTWRQAIIDLRRGVDVLTRRPEVDDQRLAYVGHSFGASIGGGLSGVEPRLRAFVLMAGMGDFTHGMRHGTGPMETAWRKSTPPEELEEFLASIEPLDGIVGVRNASAAFLFQYPRGDQYVPYERTRKYFEAAPPAKLLKIYEGGHELNEAARRDRAQWLRTHLGFASVPTMGLPMVADSPISSPEWKAAQPPEFSKLRPVLTIPGMEEIEVRKDLVYKRAGNRDLKLDLYIPEVAKRRAVPAVVLVHGLVPPAHAPFLKDTTAFAGEARWLAAHGLIVVMPELGSPARGPQPEQWFAGTQDLVANVEDAIAFVRREATTHAIDPEKLCLMVFSGGGLWGLKPVLSNPPPYLKCAVAYYPMLATQPAQPKELVPLELLRASRKPLPLLLVRAGRDNPALNASIDAFVKEARRKKAPLTLIELPEAHHAFEFTDDVESSRDAMRRTGAFLNQQLGP
ncbi:dienelactone hydrolase family protein [Hyalangium rubrum]|uniref:Dienelactone hydrolase family protein n=1 Tax=Hyalangium rubrum TaxID=3103134 RepID=A0ABU5GWW0_9BACT|nr:dienelactone hydrolase family protein [Hyalangium sp. s54d21]MDY7225581.1 dienelactone hydrolase family protein [Hyalangium sp. s54d21]